MATRPKKKVKRKDSPTKKTRVVTRITYRDVTRLRITGEDTVVFTLPDESRLVVQWLKKKGESDVDTVQVVGHT